MNVKYYKEDDILVVTLSSSSYDFAEKEGDFIVHFTKDNRPVRIEILNARKFLKKTASSVPSNLFKHISTG